MPLTNKMLSRQHAAFAAAEERKAARQAKKDEAAKAKAEKERQWLLTKESWRKKRERKDRASDLFQQRRLEDDVDYVMGRFD